MLYKNATENDRGTRIPPQRHEQPPDGETKKAGSTEKLSSDRMKQEFEAHKQEIIF